MREFPKISIVTPCLNAQEYIEHCIMSIKSQSYPNVEHIIVDGGSTDGTLDIIRKHEGSYNMRWISEKDDGMYDAIIKGFNRATGDIYAWLNSDDMYMPWACEVVASVMSKTSVKWCTGIPSFYNERGVQFGFTRMIPVYPRRYIRLGYMDGRVLGFIQQESTFWAKELWDKCGMVIKGYKLAGDFHLWKEFAKYESLVTVDSVISGFRVHSGQKTSDNTVAGGGGLSAYWAEVGGLNLMSKILRKTRIIRILSKISTYTSPKLFLRLKKILNTD